MLKESIEAADGEERISLILKECFNETIEGAEEYCDFPMVELEENLFVLELESARAFESVKESRRPMLIAAVFAAAYSDLAEGETVKLFLPFAKDLLFGAVLAKKIGVPIEIVVGVAEEDADDLKECVKALTDEKIKCVNVSKEAAHETMNNFNEYDDYVLDPVSARAASAFEEGEEDGDETPSIIVSIDSPMRYAREVLMAVGVKAKDEKEARRKLEELFAVEPIE